MAEVCECLGCNVGAKVPDFKLETYEPAKGDFGEISLSTYAHE
jgi:hypothetical protein